MESNRTVNITVNTTDKAGIIEKLQALKNNGGDVKLVLSNVDTKEFDELKKSVSELQTSIKLNTNGLDKSVERIGNQIRAVIGKSIAGAISETDLGDISGELWKQVKAKVDALTKKATLKRAESVKDIAGEVSGLSDKLDEESARVDKLRKKYDSWAKSAEAIPDTFKLAIKELTEGKGIVIPIDYEGLADTVHKAIQEGADRGILIPIEFTVEGKKYKGRTPINKAGTVYTHDGGDNNGGSSGTKPNKPWIDTFDLVAFKERFKKETGQELGTKGGSIYDAMVKRNNIAANGQEISELAIKLVKAGVGQSQVAQLARTKNSDKFNSLFAAIDAELKSRPKPDFMKDLTNAVYKYFGVKSADDEALYNEFKKGGAKGTFKSNGALQVFNLMQGIKSLPKEQFEAIKNSDKKLDIDTYIQAVAKNLKLVGNPQPKPIDELFINARANYAKEVQAIQKERDERAKAEYEYSKQFPKLLTGTVEAASNPVGLNNKEISKERGQLEFDLAKQLMEEVREEILHSSTKGSNLNRVRSHYMVDKNGNPTQKEFLYGGLNNEVENYKYDSEHYGETAMRYAYGYGGEEGVYRSQRFESLKRWDNSVDSTIDFALNHTSKFGTVVGTEGVDIPTGTFELTPLLQDYIMLDSDPKARQERYNKVIELIAKKEQEALLNTVSNVNAPVGGEPVQEEQVNVEDASEVNTALQKKVQAILDKDWRKDNSGLRHTNDIAELTGQNLSMLTEHGSYREITPDVLNEEVQKILYRDWSTPEQRYKNANDIAALTRQSKFTWTNGVNLVKGPGYISHKDRGVLHQNSDREAYMPRGQRTLVESITEAAEKPVGSNPQSVDDATELKELQSKLLDRVMEIMGLSSDSAREANRKEVVKVTDKDEIKKILAIDDMADTAIAWSALKKKVASQAKNEMASLKKKLIDKLKNSTLGKGDEELALAIYESGEYDTIDSIKEVLGIESSTPDEVLVRHKERVDKLLEPEEEEEDYYDGEDDMISGVKLGASTPPHSEYVSPEEAKDTKWNEGEFVRTGKENAITDVYGTKHMDGKFSVAEKKYGREYILGLVDDFLGKEKGTTKNFKGLPPLADWVKFGWGTDNEENKEQALAILDKLHLLRTNRSTVEDNMAAVGGDKVADLLTEQEQAYVFGRQTGYQERFAEIYSKKGMNGSSAEQRIRAANPSLKPRPTVDESNHIKPFKEVEIEIGDFARSMAGIYNLNEWQTKQVQKMIDAGGEVDDLIDLFVTANKAAQARREHPEDVKKAEEDEYWKNQIAEVTKHIGILGAEEKLHETIQRNYKAGLNRFTQNKYDDRYSEDFTRLAELADKLNVTPLEQSIAVLNNTQKALQDIPINKEGDDKQNTKNDEKRKQLLDFLGKYEQDLRQKVMASIGDSDKTVNENGFTKAEQTRYNNFLSRIKNLDTDMLQEIVDNLLEEIAKDTDSEVIKHMGSNVANALVDKIKEILLKSAEEAKKKQQPKEGEPVTETVKTAAQTHVGLSRPVYTGEYSEDEEETLEDVTKKPLARPVYTGSYEEEEEQPIVKSAETPLGFTLVGEPQSYGFTTKEAPIKYNIVPAQSAALGDVIENLVDSGEDADQNNMGAFTGLGGYSGSNRRNNNSNKQTPPNNNNGANDQDADYEPNFRHGTNEERKTEAEFYKTMNILLARLRAILAHNGGNKNSSEYLEMLQMTKAFVFGEKFNRDYGEHFVNSVLRKEVKPIVRSRTNEQEEEAFAKFHEDVIDIHKYIDENSIVYKKALELHNRYISGDSNTAPNYEALTNRAITAMLNQFDWDKYEKNHENRIDYFKSLNVNNDERINKIIEDLEAQNTEYVAGIRTKVPNYDTAGNTIRRILANPEALDFEEVVNKDSFEEWANSKLETILDLVGGYKFNRIYLEGVGRKVNYMNGSLEHMPDFDSLINQAAYGYLKDTYQTPMQDESDYAKYMPIIKGYGNDKIINRIDELHNLLQSGILSKPIDYQGFINKLVADKYNSINNPIDYIQEHRDAMDYFASQNALDSWQAKLADSMYKAFQNDELQAPPNYEALKKSYITERTKKISPETDVEFDARYQDVRARLINAAPHAVESLKELDDIVGAVKAGNLKYDDTRQLKMENYIVKALREENPVDMNTFMTNFNDTLQKVQLAGATDTENKMNVLLDLVQKGVYTDLGNIGMEKYLTMARNEAIRKGTDTRLSREDKKIALDDMRDLVVEMFGEKGAKTKLFDTYKANFNKGPEFNDAYGRARNIFYAAEKKKNDKENGKNVFQEQGEAIKKKFTGWVKGLPVAIGVAAGKGLLDLFKKGIGAIFDIGKKIITTSLKPIKILFNGFKSLLQKAISQSKTISNMIELGVMPLLLMVEFTLLPVLLAIIDPIKSLITWTVENKETFTKIGNALGTLIVPFLETIAKTLEDEKFKSLISTLDTLTISSNSAKTSLSETADSVSDDLQSISDDEKDASNLLLKVSDVALSMADNILTTFAQDFSKWWGTKTTYIETDENGNETEVTKTYGERVGELIAKVIRTGLSIAEQYIITNAGIIADIIKEITSSITGMFEKKEFSTVITAISEAIKSVIELMIKFIKQPVVWDSIKTLVSELWSIVWEAISDFFGIGSVKSEHTEELGKKAIEAKNTEESSTALTNYGNSISANNIGISTSMVAMINDLKDMFEIKSTIEQSLGKSIDKIVSNGDRITGYTIGAGVYDFDNNLVGIDTTDLEYLAMDIKQMADYVNWSTGDEFSKRQDYMDTWLDGKLKVDIDLNVDNGKVTGYTVKETGQKFNLMGEVISAGYNP